MTRKKKPHYKHKQAAKKTPQRKHIPVLFYTILGSFLVPLLVFMFLKFLPDTAVLQSTTQKPNIIVVMTDDQRYDALETMPTVRNTLAKNGMTFTNMFHNNPWCCPSRATFLTGLYTHNTGVWTVPAVNGGYKKFVENGNEEKTFAIKLQEAGYKTGLFGKYLNGYETPTVPAGWDRWFAMVRGQRYYGYEISNNGTLETFGNRDEDYITDVLRDQAKEFISSTSEPFFLFFSTPAPHSTTDRVDENDADEKHLAQIAPRHEADCSVTAWRKPPSYNEKDVSDKPKWVKRLSNKRSQKEVQIFRKSQLCSLIAVDEAIAGMIETLGPEKMENTIFIFLSDNGYAYGEHRYSSKPCFYEECIRGPLVISYPALFDSAKKTDALVSNVDIPATILDFAGVKDSLPMDGKSLLPLLKGEKAGHRNSILLEVQNLRHNYKGYGIRTPKYKYIEYDSGEKELYTIIGDPYELKNKAGSKKFNKLRKNLAKRLAILKKSGASGQASVLALSASPGQEDEQLLEQLEEEEPVVENPFEIFFANSRNFISSILDEIVVRFGKKE